MSDSVGSIILEQLGGRGFALMTGIAAIIRYRNGLVVKFGEGAEEGLNLLRVKLDDMDTYTVDFGTVAGEGELPDLLPTAEWHDKHHYEGIYNDSLRSLFKEVTGFEPTPFWGPSPGSQRVEL